MTPLPVPAVSPSLPAIDHPASAPAVPSDAPSDTPSDAPSDAPSAAPSDAPSPRLVALCLGILYTVWSSTYLALRYVVEEMPPLASAGGRFLLAGFVLLCVVRARRIPLPTVPQMRIAALTGILVFAMGNGFVALAEQKSSSGLAAVVCASMPCFAAVFDALGGRKLGA